MQRSAKVVLFLMILGAAVSFAVLPTLPRPGGSFEAGSTIRVKSSTGTGSGVHIGGGYILTAAHVTKSDRTAVIALDNGTEIEGEVLWHNDGDLGSYDVAVIYVGPQPALAKSDISCAPNYVGQEIRIVGNPVGMIFQTTWGRVSGYLGSPHAYWREAVALDITTAAGVSGGPVFDQTSGKVVGMLVGGYVGLGYSVMVPGSALCRLLVRDA